jgi:hypothetical protein
MGVPCTRGAMDSGAPETLAAGAMPRQTTVSKSTRLLAYTRPYVCRQKRAPGSTEAQGVAARSDGVSKNSCHDLVCISHPVPKECGY